MTWLGYSLIILGSIIVIIIVVVACFYTSNSSPNRFSKMEVERNQRGARHMSESSITIGGLARNSSIAFEENIKFFERMAGLFKQVNVAILENDSEDNTRELYLDYIDNNQIPNLDIKLVNSGQVNLREAKFNMKRTFTSEKTHPRLKKMVHLRNDLSESIKSVFGETDYIYISDFDIKGPISEEGIKNSFGHFEENPDIDSISFYGLRRYGPLKIPFDEFSYRDYEGSDSKYPTLGKHILCLKPVVQTGLYRVGSHFGGGFFARYRALEKSQYEFVPLDNCRAECEHISFFRKINAFVNTNMIRYIDFHIS